MWWEMKDVRRPTVATIASGITAVFLVTGAAGIELEHSLRLTAKGAKGRDNGELYGVMFDADGIIYRCRARSLLNTRIE